MMILSLPQYILGQSSNLRYCSIANTTVIPLTTSLTGQQQPGILCPFGFIKQRNITSGLFTCQSVMDLLNDIVDKKDCFLPPGRDNEKSLPYFDTTNCIFNYLHCSPRTRKCTLFNTRSLGDACVDRFSCAGSVQKNHINCFEGICTTLERDEVLPIGSSCSVDPSAPNFSSFVSYENNTFATCNNESTCVSTSGSLMCVRVQQERAKRFGTCGMMYTSTNWSENNTTVVVASEKSIVLCEDAHLCSFIEHGKCLPNYASTDFFDKFRLPFTTFVDPHHFSLSMRISSTLFEGRRAYVKQGTEFCTDNQGCSGNALDVFAALQIKSSYSYIRGPVAFNGTYSAMLSKCDTSLKKCIRVFGKENGMPCSENAECRSTYCSPFNNMTCSELPKEVACGPSVSSASLSDCPGYSQCVCTNSSRGVCMSLCFAELTDLHSCSYNFGMVGSNSAISKMENTLIPFYDNQSSIFSLENGKCKEYMIKYFECMKNIQQEMNLETHDLPYSPLTRRNGMTGKSLSLSEPNDIVLKSNLANLSLSEDETDVFAIAEVNLTNIENNQFSNISEVSLTRIDMFNESSSSMLMQVSSMYSNFNISEQVVVYILERMAGLIPKYKTKEINFRSTLKVCGCCTPTVTNYLQDSLHGGILLKGNDSNILSSGLIAFSDLSLSNTISGFEPIMGHNSFLNRNWYEKCDIILVPAEDIDVITLSVKNNMLILDRNSTDGNSLKELEEKINE
ncbi:hypothetical protein FDP41_000663 [Naegleria fowleri]|uniref:Uncharacterized protein n=1 Tax=Naegleria fowleri TaxID=5763 RepID=A0A6A5CDV9_NAEFO|nr:uncharacterized protein FDP41_000663 [Naegleria fowleri]KAF0984764.1 hypothetical protein FDP41_000663 [Naegleria fowleri]